MWHATCSGENLNSPKLDVMCERTQFSLEAWELVQLLNQDNSGNELHWPYEWLRKALKKQEWAPEIIKILVYYHIGKLLKWKLSVNSPKMVVTHDKVWHFTNSGGPVTCDRWIEWFSTVLASWKWFLPMFGCIGTAVMQWLRGGTHKSRLWWEMKFFVTVCHAY